MPGAARIRRRDVRFGLVFAGLQVLAYAPALALMYGLSAMWSPEGQEGGLHWGSLVGVVIVAGVVFAVAFAVVLGLSAVTGLLDWIVRDSSDEGRR